MSHTFLTREMVRRSPRKAGPPTAQRLRRRMFASWTSVRSSDESCDRKVRPAGAEQSGFIYRHVGRKTLRNQRDLLDRESRGASFGPRNRIRWEALLAVCPDRDSIFQPARAPLGGIRRTPALRVARSTTN